MKILPALLCFFVLPLLTCGQGMWTWVKGANTPNAAAVYGSRGVAANANTPRGLYAPVAWTDLQGNFWLFGGVDNNSNCYNDLWKYDNITNTWTWIKGPGVSGNTGTYGTIGVPALTNNPPARGYGSAMWTDMNGDLWLYGGYRGGYYADLWRYQISTNTWTWMHGPTGTFAAPVYGTQGIPSINNNPGQRGECCANWVDSNNNLWLFGGFANGPSMNDLWRYNIVTNEWTWMKGANTVNQPGIYGTKGVPDIANTPGARSAHSSWTDANGDFWLFGGAKYTSPSIFFNDVWRYTPADNNWTWMSGTSISDDTGSYGPPCSSSVNYVPAARYESRSRWKDACGNFWLYGGGKGAPTQDTYSDLWSFNPTTLAWTLAKGSNGANVAPTYGTVGIAAPANSPGSRQGTATWKSNNGDLYVFGGNLTNWPNSNNDLWKFTIDPNCPPGAGALFDLGSDTTYCDNFSRVLTTGDVHTLWSTGDSATQITVSSAGTYWARVNSACGILTDTIVLGRQNAPAPFSLGQDTTYCGNFARVLATSDPNTYWNTGVTAPQINIVSPGIYWARSANACGVLSDTIAISLQNLPSGFNLGMDTTYCFNFSRVLSTGNPNTHWSNNTTASQITVTTSGSYWASISNACGSIADTINIAQSVAPTVNLGNDTSLCNGQSLVLNATTLNGGYHWQDNSTNATLTVLTTGVYAVTVTTPEGCTSTDNIAINISSGFSLSSTVVNASCGNNNGSLTVIPTTGAAPFGYVWNTGDTVSTLNNLAAGTYRVTVTDVNGCSATTSKAINSSQATPVSIAADISVICANDSARICALVGAVTYLWNAGQNDSCIYARLAGNYYVTVTDNNGCTAESNHVALSVYPLPPVAISVKGDTLSVYNAATQQWYLNGSAINGATNPIYIADQGGSYTVAVTDSNGCEAISNAVIITDIGNLREENTISIFPNPAFSELNVYVNGERASQVYIYNTQGQLLSEIKQLGNKSIDVTSFAQGVYIVEIKLKTTAIRKRWVKM